jgi:hypothetical protein
MSSSSWSCPSFFTYIAAGGLRAVLLQLAIVLRILRACIVFFLHPVLWLDNLLVEKTEATLVDVPLELLRAGCRYLAQTSQQIVNLKVKGDQK